MALLSPRQIQPKFETTPGKKGGGKFGQVAGGLLGAAIGGIAGTLAAPGVGTAAGIAAGLAGAGGGMATGGGLGSLLGEQLSPAQAQTQRQVVPDIQSRISNISSKLTPQEIQAPETYAQALIAASQEPPEVKRQTIPQLTQGLKTALRNEVRRV